MIDTNCYKEIDIKTTNGKNQSRYFNVDRVLGFEYSSDKQKCIFSNTTPKVEFIETTNQYFKQPLSDEKESLYYNEQIDYSIERYNVIYSDYKNLLIKSLAEFDYGFESLLVSESIIQEIIENFEYTSLGSILQEISIDYYDNKKVLCGICQCMERFDLEAVYPWGPILTLSILMHKDDNVKAYAISLIDNWADRTLLPMLNNIECTSGWLKSYVHDIIERVEV